MKRERIENSSNIAEVGYNYNKRVLQIKFHNGGIYDYSPVTEYAHRELMAAESKGQFFKKNIKDAPGIKTKKVG